MNPMRAIRLEKVTLNMGAGDAHQKVESSKKLLSLLTGKKVVVTKTKKRTTFGSAKGRDIGAMVTLRGKEAEDMLKRLMGAIESLITPTHFDVNGNFSFGIKEYVHIPGMNYYPDIGILGFDVAVTLTRPGYRVRKRRIRPAPLGKQHIITAEEAMQWAQSFGFVVRSKESEQ